jgi:hypothetical protein
MSEQRSPITAYIAIAEGDFLNLRAGDVFDVEAMLRLFTRDEVLQVPLGHRPLQRQHPRSGARPQSQSPIQSGAPRETADCP